jgi:hypothetical protein
MRKLFAILIVLTFVSGAALAHCGHCGVGDKPAAAGDHKCGDACPAKGKEVTKTTEGAAVTGTIKCLHCDLHKGTKCQKVLVTADNKIYQFCPDSLKDVKLDKHQGKTVTAKGSVMEIKDADPVIHLTALEPKA